VTLVDRNGVILARYPEPETWVGQVVPEVSSLSAILAGEVSTPGERQQPDAIFALGPHGDRDVNGRR